MVLPWLNLRRSTANIIDSTPNSLPETLWPYFYHTSIESFLRDRCSAILSIAAELWRAKKGARWKIETLADV